MKNLRLQADQTGAIYLLDGDRTVAVVPATNPSAASDALHLLEAAKTLEEARMSTHVSNPVLPTWRVQRAYDVYPLSITEGDAVIAVVRETMKEATPEARAAGALSRARVMALSPQLLASIEGMLDMMENDHADEIAQGHGGDDSCSYCTWMNEARALIAQADCEVSA